MNAITLHRRVGMLLRLCLLHLVLLPAAVWAQVPQPVAPTPPGQAPQRVPEPDPLLGHRDAQIRDPLDPVWTDIQRRPFDGFPVFPSRLSGYGNSPLQGQPGGQLPGNIPLLPLAAPATPGWPGWARLRDRQALPFAVDLALLVRHADRVWWRAAPADAFVPLYFHDKLRTLQHGAEVQVRQAGEFELLLHTSTRLVAQGPTDLQLGALTETSIELDVRHFTRLRLQTQARDHVVHLPDGSQLQIAGAPAEGEAEGQVLVLLQRADKPSRFGGRATIFNAGARAVRWQNAFGVTRIAPGQRVTMFLRPAATSIGAGLSVTGTSTTADAAGVRCQGADGAELSWCGARFQVGSGRSVRLLPLQGEPFAPPSVSSSAQSAGTQ